jgi:hypothetical protein
VRPVYLVSTRCLCGGELSANGDGLLAHSLPFCEHFDKVETTKDAADLLERCRLKNDAKARA